MRDITPLPNQHSYKIVKANELIQKTRFNLSTLEQKTILYIISKIKPEDTELQDYEFKIIEYCEICGINYDNGGNYRYIKQVLKTLRDKSVWIELEDGTETTLSWVEKVFISKRSGTIRVKLDPFMKPYLLQLKDHFTQYELLYTLAMKSQYSIRFYEIFKSYQNLCIKRFRIDELKKTLSAENYKRFPDFRRFVLDISVREINAFSDLEIRYDLEKEGRRYAWVNFHIHQKKEIEEKLEVWNRIHRTLRKNTEV